MTAFRPTMPECFESPRDMFKRPPILTALLGWPEGYSKSDYTSVLNLCSALDGRVIDHHSKNMGCICSGPGSSYWNNLQCHESVADPNLFYQQLNDEIALYYSFYDLCMSLCRCRDPNAAASNTNTTNTQLASGVIATGEDLYAPGTDLGGSNWTSSTGSPDWDWSGSDTDTELPVPGSHVNLTTINHQCYANCTAQAECAGGCTCRAVSHTFIPGASGNGPGSSISQYRMACIFAPIGTDTVVGGKREVAAPCACNSSWVSHGCCDSADGIVWESGSSLGVVNNDMKYYE